MGVNAKANRDDGPYGATLFAGKAEVGAGLSARDLNFKLGARRGWPTGFGCKGKATFGSGGGTVECCRSEQGTEICNRGAKRSPSALILIEEACRELGWAQRWRCRRFGRGVELVGGVVVGMEGQEFKRVTGSSRDGADLLGDAEGV